MGLGFVEIDEAGAGSPHPRFQNWLPISSARNIETDDDIGRRAYPPHKDIVTISVRNPQHFEIRQLIIIICSVRMKSKTRLWYDILI